MILTNRCNRSMVAVFHLALQNLYFTHERMFKKYIVIRMLIMLAINLHLALSSSGMKCDGVRNYFDQINITKFHCYKGSV